jgi:hypothetical protein
MESRMVKDTSYADTMFILREEGDKKFVTFPKNLESFADNLFMISLIRLAYRMGWTIQLSTKELPASVFETSEGAYFAGFICASALKETGEYSKGITKFSKGYASYQTYSVEKAYGKLPWLRTGGMDSLLQRLSTAKGFTREYWALRGSVAALLKMIPGTTVTHLKSFFLPKNEVMKHIKTKLVYENGGLFRTSEIAYLNDRYVQTKTMLNDFLIRLDNPTEEFVQNFVREYTPLKTAIEAVEKETKLIAVNRSKVLFPSGEKKSVKKFKALPLSDKLTKLAEKGEISILPETLPGITRINAEVEAQPGSLQWLGAQYPTVTSETGREVILSWFTTYSPQFEEEE